MKINTIINRYNIVIGSIDAITGILLVCCPQLVLLLLGINQIPEQDVYLRFVGVFVCSTGLAYYIPFLWQNSLRATATRIIWIYTTLVRTLVCIFIVYNFLSGTLDKNWLIVAATDGGLAFWQVCFFRKLRFGNQYNENV